MFALPSALFARFRPETALTAAPLDLAALVGAAGWAQLPAAVQRRFGAAHADTTYTGHMELRCSRAGRLFAWASKCFGSPLTSINAVDVPATVRVSDNGHGGVTWERLFDGGGEGGAQMVRSTKEIAPGGGLMERTDGGLSMSLDVFEEDGSLVFLSRRFWFVMGRLHMPLPAVLSPGVFRVTHTDLGRGLFRFTLSIVHPWWGETFYQSGVFADPF